MFNNLKLRGRILWGYSVPIILSIGVTGLVFFNVQEVQRKFESVEKANRILEEIQGVAFHIATMQKAARGYLIVKSDTSLQAYKEDFQLFQERSKELRELIEDPEQQKSFQEIFSLGQQVAEYDDTLIALVDQGKTNEAINVWKKGEGRVLGEKLDELLNSFTEAEREILQEREKAERSTLQSLNMIVLLGNLFSSGLALAIGLWIAGAISRLIREAASNVASSSTEINATAEKQDRTATEQASAVNQTTATLEELGAASRQSAEQAEASATGARQALDLAENGTKAVHKTMEEMAVLKDRVEAIAEQIMRLSEQTTQIGSISDLVADLANQTNMLALNAAVEAARAGEHGKGFSVVAGEIRKLADQSKKSAEKINALVTDVQASINSTVMVTDEGTKSVDQGLKLTQGTAETFTGVADAVNHVFLNSQQISLSSKQQAVSVQQVVSAMNEINMGAKDTASGTNQVKVTTKQLQEAAQKMLGIV